MADTVQLGAPVGSGAVVASDDAGAAGQVQIIKLAISADGSATVIPADATVGLRVDPASVAVADGGTLPGKGVQIGGTDGTVFQVMSTDNAGRPNVNINGTVPVSGPLTDAQLRASAVPIDSELPAAAALADGAANPTAPAVGAFGLLWNGATWDRAPGSATGGLTTNLKQLNGTTIATNSGTKDAGTQRVVIATDQIQLTNALKVDPSGVTSPVSLASLPALAAGSNLVGRVNLDPQTANGLSIFHLVSAATTNATNLKASAGQVYGWYIYNSNAAARKVVFHNTAGTPTAGASVIFAIVIPPTSAANVFSEMGLAFATGIALTTVTDLTDAGATAVAASDLIINIFFK